MTRLAATFAALVFWLCAASTAQAARSEFFGIAQGPLDASDVQRMAEVGIGTERFMLKWRSVEPTQGSYDWAPRDWLVGALASRGIRPVPFVWGSPEWVNQFSARPPVDTASNVQAWRNFLKAAVERYGPGGSYWANGYRQRFGPGATPLPIRSWQIWNEPNLSKYFDPGQTVGHAAQKYARLLEISHDAIKSRDPQARIVLAGMPGFGDSTAWKFLDSLYRVSGARKDFDAAALHPYARNLDQLDQQAEQFRAVMNSHGDRTTPLWLTELAWGSGPSDQFGYNKGLAGQRDLLSGAFELILSRRSAWNVERIFWYLWHDPPAGSVYAGLCSICGTAGLVRHNRTPKPAYDAFTGFTAETTPPVARIFGPAEGSITEDVTPTFEFASSEPGSTFECRFAQDYFPCGSPLIPGSSLPDGPHAFNVRAIDAPGNESAVRTRSFIVEARPPSVTISSGPAEGSTSSDQSPSFGFASNEPETSFRCRLDGGGFEDCGSPFTASDLTEGLHTFRVRATDRAGKQSSTASRAWAIDGAVDLSITAGPAPGSAIKDTTPRFAFSSPDKGASFQCRIEGDPFVSCTSPFTASTLTDGDHRFTVRATDTAQNVAVVSRDFTVDTIAPTVTVSSGPANGAATNDTTPTFRFFSTEAGSSFQCRYEDGDFSPCSGAGFDTASPLPDGPHLFSVRPTDAAENKGPAFHTIFTVDTVAPKLKIEGPSNTRMKSDRASATFTLKASGQVRRRCHIDLRRTRPCPWRYRSPELTRSSHTLTVKAIDRAGNVKAKRMWFTLAGQWVPRRTRRPSQLRCNGAAATLVGSYRSDRLTGTDGRDVIVAFAGNDKIDSRGGRDMICARHGDDEVTAGPGADWVRGGRGADTLGSGGGADTVRAGWGIDSCARDSADRRFHCEVLGLR